MWNLILSNFNIWKYPSGQYSYRPIPSISLGYGFVLGYIRVEYAANNPISLFTLLY